MMAHDTGLLREIVEADQTYVGGKRKRGQESSRDGDGDQPKGRGGSRKAMVVTAVERRGRARAKKGGTHCERTIVGCAFLFGHASSGGG
jgi:ISXO2-like transposase domain